MKESRAHEDAFKARLAQLRAEVAEGLEQARRGDLLEGQEVRERLLAKSRERRRGAAQD